MQFLAFLFDKHLDKTVLVAVLVVSLVFLNLPEASKVNKAKVVTSFLLYPVNKVSRYFASVEELRQENTDLKRMVATLYHERERLLQFRDERNRLRKLLGFKEDSFYRFMPCEVIANSSERFLHSVVVDRGKVDGVKVGMAVVDYRGLVGRVIEVFPHSARVMLINNKSCSVSCIDKRSRVVGILEWERGNLFSLEYVGSSEDVRPQDTLITSGFGKLFPKGFTVGTIFHVADEKGGLARKVSAVAFSDLNKLEELFIVVGGRKWEENEIYDELEKLSRKKSGVK
ncbi:MAG: rod shape-determining protein MreC [Candidatus Latescibacteria bacterium 4484_7]|nr:MAG: rod shape-determining protein MreC [Candidatus Latescibacteria bacterium 4484_7]